LHGVSDKELTLQDLKPEDSGMYECNATNLGGTVDKSYQLTVTCK